MIKWVLLNKSYEIIHIALILCTSSEYNNCTTIKKVDIKMII